MPSTPRHWKLCRVTLEAEVEGSKGQRSHSSTLVLEGQALNDYVGVFWRAPNQKTKGAPEMLVEIYRALIANSRGPKQKRHQETLEQIQAQWQNSPAVNLKDPDCGSDPWPTLGI